MSSIEVVVVEEEEQGRESVLMAETGLPANLS